MKLKELYEYSHLKDLTAEELQVYLYIKLAHSNYSLQTIDSIAEEFVKSQKQVRRIITGLLNKGYILSTSEILTKASFSAKR